MFQMSSKMIPMEFQRVPKPAYPHTRALGTVFQRSSKKVPSHGNLHTRALETEFQISSKLVPKHGNLHTRALGTEFQIMSKMIPKLANLSPCWWISWWIGQVLGWFIPCSQKEGHENKLFFAPAKRNPLWNAKTSVSGRTFSSFLVLVLGPNEGTSDDTEIGHPLSKSYKEVLI